MFDLLLLVALGPILSELLIIAAILVVLFVILKLGRLILGLILNSILGLLLIWIVNALFGLGYRLTCLPGLYWRSSDCPLLQS